MQSSVRSISTVIIVFVMSGNLWAHQPVEFLQVLKVKPANLIEHDVELKDVYDSERLESELVGPHYFSFAVGALGRKAKETTAFQHWYRITNPRPRSERTVKVLDLVRGGENMELKIADAEFFLTPAQRITTGSPDPVPEGLDQYRAYRVIEPVKLNRTIEINDGSQMVSRRLLAPIYICVATEEWHHDEYFAATHPRACLVVYELEAADSDQTYHTLDQFGLNQLQAVQDCWLAVRGSLLDAGTP